MVAAMNSTRKERARALEKWADAVGSRELRRVDTEVLRDIVELVDMREHVEQDLDAAVRAARQADRSWSEIGTMLGVSKQAAQHKYGNKTNA